MQLVLDSGYLNPRSRLVLAFRTFGYAAIAILAIIFPETGEYRYWLALVTFTAGPLTLVLAKYFNSGEHEWVDPLFDLCMVLGLIHLVPDMWVPALCIGLMIALAPSVSLHPSSHKIYGLFGSLLVIGMGFAGWMYKAENWLLIMLVISAIYPSVIFYARWQTQRTEALRERDQLMRNLYQLAGSVAHDFNNVLTGIGGHAELAMMALPEDHEAYLDMSEVLNGVDRAGLLCRQLLSFSMYEEAPQNVDLVDEVRSLTHLLKPVVPKGVDLIVQSDVDSLPTFVSRPQIQQAFMNIILNAGEAVINDPSPVKIVLQQVQRNGQAAAQISITDQGVGIPREQLRRVFDPMFTTKDKGHGLGLSSVDKALQANQGYIDIASQVGLGTTVTIALPLSEGLSNEEEQSSRVDAAGEIALVVDDELAVRQVTSRFLEQMGYRVSQAATAEEAIVLLKTRIQQCGIVILDLDMPYKDGWWCLRELRSFNAATRVVICSGYDPATTNPPELTDNEILLRKPFHKIGLERAIGSFVT